MLAHAGPATYDAQASTKGDHMAGKFELYKDKAGKFRFRLKASNGQIIATSSEAYESKSAAQNGIDSIKRHATEAAISDLTA